MTFDEILQWSIDLNSRFKIDDAKAFLKAVDLVTEVSNRFEQKFRREADIASKEIWRMVTLREAIQKKIKEYENATNSG